MRRMATVPAQARPPGGHSAARTAAVWTVTALAGSAAARPARRADLGRGGPPGDAAGDQQRHRRADERGDDRAFIGADAWFCGIAVVAGLLTGIVGYRFGVRPARRRRRAVIAAGLILGGVAGAFVMLWLGEQIGLSAYNQHLASSANGTVFHASLALGAKSALAFWPMFTAIVILVGEWGTRRTRDSGEPDAPDAPERRPSRTSPHGRRASRGRRRSRAQVPRTAVGLGTGALPVGTALGTGDGACPLGTGMGVRPVGTAAGAAGPPYARHRRGRPPAGRGRARRRRRELAGRPARARRRRSDRLPRGAGHRRSAGGRDWRPAPRGGACRREMPLLPRADRGARGAPAAQQGQPGDNAGRLDSRGPGPLRAGIHALLLGFANSVSTGNYVPAGGKLCRRGRNLWRGPAVYPRGGTGGRDGIWSGARGDEEFVDFATASYGGLATPATC